MMKKRNKIISILIFFAAFAFQILLQGLMKEHAINGMYFQTWSSEDLMQTVSIEDLHRKPFESLFFLHIQPPLLNALRAAFVNVLPANDYRSRIRNVDKALYFLWAVIYALICAVIFFWLADMTGTKYAAVCAIIFALHPASIFYATFLDTTILNAFLLLWLMIVLFRIKKHPEKGALFLVIPSLLLFFTHGAFQIPVFVLLAASLILIRVRVRKVLLFFVLSGGIAAIFIAKQYVLFNLPSTSSFTGFNLCRSIGFLPDYFHFLDNIPPGTPIRKTRVSVLSQKKKPNGSPNFNNIAYLEYNRHLIKFYADKMKTLPISKIAASYLENVNIYFQPSSTYSRHMIADRLAWKKVYDTCFSMPFFPILIILGFLFRVYKLPKKDYLPDIGLALPVLFVFSVTVLFEKGENMRFKYYLEPVLFVFVSFQCHAFFLKLERHWKKRNKNSGISDAGSGNENRNSDFLL